jgi:diguanylate cyclase (GGDEF)-like protein
MIAVWIGLCLVLLWVAPFGVVASRLRRLRRQSAENERLARYDQLTGLPNRTLFRERFARALRDGTVGGEGVAVLLLDLDRFKQINDTLGHHAGDTVLIEVARRLRETLPPELSVARLGNDEFAVLGPHTKNHTDALETAARIRSTMEEPVELHGAAVNVDASIGIAIAPEHGSEEETLFRRAEMALAHARSHRSIVEIYCADHDHFEAARMKLLGDVHPALERGELVLFYQPTVDLASGAVTGVEALLRWRHPQRGMLAPLEFMPMIEQTALIGAVARRVIDLALGQLAAWRRAGLELDVAVNLSACNLHDPLLPGDIAQLLKSHGIPGSSLTVEVTESAAMTDTDRALRVLSALRTLGVGVSIDDFGSGHASIAYLASLPATEVKIDRTLIASMCESPRDEAIARTTIDLARHLDLRVVAEGIETAEVARRLVEIGCDTGQGYLYSRPIPPDELTEWLTSRPGTPRRRPVIDA